MVWEQHSLVIVMTTRVMERGRPKCHQYWEPVEGAEVSYGQFLIKTETIDTNDDYTVSTLQVTDKKVHDFYFQVEILIDIPHIFPG